MFLLKKLLAAWLLPPLGLLLIALAGLAIARRRRSGLVVAAAAISLLLLLSLPLVANILARPLEGVPITAAALHEVQAIVILGGGVYYGAPEYDGDTVGKYSLERVRYGAKLARETKLPVLVTGGIVYGGRAEGELMKQVLESEFAVPVRWAEAQSRDTAENAFYSAPLLKTAGIHRIALVTHAWHMPRAVACFKHAGLEVIPAPTGFTPRDVSLFESLLPSAAALERSSLAIREWTGRLLFAAGVAQLTSSA